MSSKLIFVSLCTGVILLTAIFLQVKRYFWDSPFTQPTTPVITTSTPVSNENPRLSNTDKALVKDYLKAKLSQLSPIPESLGGTFYLTELIFTSTTSADIAYEDGHHSYQATINFSINENQVNINNFSIISQNKPLDTATSTLETPTSNNQ